MFFKAAVLTVSGGYRGPSRRLSQMVSEALVRDEVFLAGIRSKCAIMDVFLGIFLNFSEQLKFLGNFLFDLRRRLRGSFFL